MEQKRGEGKQRFLKGGQPGSRSGCIKKGEGAWNPLANYFSLFGLNTQKYGPEMTPYLDTFHAVPSL